MRFVKRPEASEPPSLVGPCTAIQDERRAAARYYAKIRITGNSAKSFPFSAYRQKDIKIALAKMFDRKCAYCESEIRSNGDDEIEHFRPKGGVEGEEHLGYWWLAHCWTNLLPSCSACNQKRLVHVLHDFVTLKELTRLLNTVSSDSFGKSNYFPISGKRATKRKEDLQAEVPLLINPTIQDPADHIRWAFKRDMSLVRPVERDGRLDEVGRETIKAYSLNRVELVAKRKAQLSLMTYRRDQALSKLEKAGYNDPDWLTALELALDEVKILKRHCRKDQEFTAMKRAMVIEFDQVLRARLERYNKARQA